MENAKKRKDWLSKAAEEGGLAVNEEQTQNVESPEQMTEVNLEEIIREDPRVGEIYEWFRQVLNVQESMDSVYQTLTQLLEEKGVKVEHVPEITQIITQFRG